MQAGFSPSATTSLTHPALLLFLHASSGTLSAALRVDAGATGPARDHPAQPRRAARLRVVDRVKSRRHRHDELPRALQRGAHRPARHRAAHKRPRGARPPRLRNPPAAPLQAAAHSQNRHRRPGTRPAAAQTPSASFRLGARRPQIRDVVDRSSAGGAASSVTVDGLLELPIGSWAEAAAVLAGGEERRHVAATLMNRHSSRSHTILRLGLAVTDASAGTVRARGRPRRPHPPAAAAPPLLRTTSPASSPSRPPARPPRRSRARATCPSSTSPGASAPPRAWAPPPPSPRGATSTAASSRSAASSAGSRGARERGAAPRRQAAQRPRRAARVEAKASDPLPLPAAPPDSSSENGERGHVPYRDAKLTRLLQARFLPPDLCNLIRRILLSFGPTPRGKPARRG